MEQILRTLCRKKDAEVIDFSETKLRRCLSTFELTLIGIGSTIGVGLYVIAGHVARDEAGPGILLSFTIAGAVSLLSALCYAEVACKIPRTGSAYSFAYVTCGEFVAFFVGWNMLMEMVIGTAGVGRATSQYIDACFNYELSRHLSNIFFWWPDGGPVLGQYPDFLGFASVIIVTGVLLLGVNVSSKVNIALTAINLTILMIFASCGCFLIDFKNLTYPNGFLPYGTSGMLTGAASCFYAFVGFDCTTAMSEETKVPTKSIPKAIALTLIICYISYMICSAVLVLAIPFNQIPEMATLTEVFRSKSSLVPLAYVIDLGAVIALLASIVSGLLPIPRILYAIASDGLLPPFLGHIWDNNETPAAALVVCGLSAAVFTLTIDLGGLVEMMSIGTLIAYSVVAASVIILRYSPRYQIFYAQKEIVQVDQLCRAASLRKQKTTEYVEGPNQQRAKPLQREAFSLDQADVLRDKKVIPPLQAIDDSAIPTEESYRVVQMALGAAVVAMVPFSYFITTNLHSALEGNVFFILFTVAGTTAVVVCSLIIASQPQWEDSSKSSSGIATPLEDNRLFQVPLVPFVPLLAILCNFCLMFGLHILTWIRLAIWMTVGLVVYFGYSVRFSKLRATGPSAYRLINAT